MKIKKDGKTYTDENGGISRVINRTDVINIIESINMTLKEYEIYFELDAKENLQCVYDGVPDLISKAEARAVKEERDKIREAWEKLNIISVGAVGLAQGLLIKNSWGEDDSTQVSRKYFKDFMNKLNGEKN